MIRTLAIAMLLAAPAPVAAETIAIVHASAFTMTAPQPVRDATIVVTDGRIVSVGSAAAAPPGVRVIDAHGHIVTPGLFDPATQIGLVEIAGARDTDDRTVANGPLGAAFDVSFALSSNSTLVPVARADGVTQAMSFPGASATQPFAGAGALVRLREHGPLLERPRAAMFAAIGNGTQAKAGGSRAAQWVLLRNALAEARAFGASPPLRGPRDQLLDRPDIEALQPVMRGTMPLALVVDRESDIREAIALSSDMHVHVVIVGGAEAWRQAHALAAAHIPVILDPEVNLPQNFDWIGARLDNAAILAKAGVTIAFSVSGNSVYLSYDAGLAMRDGAGIAVANGLPYFDALRAITATPAAIWGVQRAGTLAPGADADLVIWDGDPLEPASAPIMVLIDGKPASMATRMTALRDRYAPQRANDPLPPAYR
ncbi:amidohydrolase family protein [Sphingomonas sp.]|uniref:amidohydrolase family protein n=1 Tax=Sphingomonas sp. TaxID=28214 RepID=UPI003B007958